MRLKRLSVDSQLQTLIHEVTHFNDVAGSTDDYYGARNAITNKSRANIIKNADSLASYILGMNVKPMPSGEQ